MQVFLTRWMRDFRVDGLRLDSIENVGNWDFVSGFRQLARQLFEERWPAGSPAAAMLARFLVVGEELQLPLNWVTSGTLDGLWNEDFQERIRAAILGESVGGEDFERTVQKAINCLSPGGFSDGAQVINYVTKHDVEGRRHERLFTMLRNFPRDQIEKRIKLAFTCLLTAVGIPLFLAGEEFGDEHDLFGLDGVVSQNGGKQVDPVNFSRLTATPKDTDASRDEFFAGVRQRILAYVKPLIKFRTREPALSVNDTEFFWTDFGDGKRVLAWRRGAAAQRPVVVVANFSDFASAPGTDYRIPTWPRTPAGKQWIDVSQGNRLVTLPGTEPIFAWEAKVYTLVDI
jgi:pullulanase